MPNFKMKKHPFYIQKSKSFAVLKKPMENTHGGVTLLVKLHAEA